YHRAWEGGSPQVRSDVAGEVLRLYEDDALPFLRTHLLTPADVDAVYQAVLGVFCTAQRSSLRLMTRVEVLSLFTREIKATDVTMDRTAPRAWLRLPRGAH
ncbi:MAG TPA: hypothetical protein VGB96_20320, partial [Archangium sp.]